MAKYYKKPIIIDAVQFDPQRPWPDGVLPWPDEQGIQPRDMSWGYINTLEGRHHVHAGDWIITGIAGEKYLCKSDLFKKTYEPVRNEPRASMTVELEHDGKLYKGVLYAIAQEEMEEVHGRETL